MLRAGPGIEEALELDKRIIHPPRRVLRARLNRSEAVGSRRDLTGRVGHAPFPRSGYTAATTLTAAKGRGSAAP